MQTFAERLKLAISKRELSQAEAARRCGISQQSINYIINNNLASSKLAAQIASALGINPEWLVYGRGKFEETKVYEIPIIHSVYMLKKFLNSELDENTFEYTVIDTFLGQKSFAYLFDQRTLLICCECGVTSFDHNEYLAVQGGSIKVTQKKSKIGFAIYERRIRNVDY